VNHVWEPHGEALAMTPGLGLQCEKDGAVDRFVTKIKSSDSV